MYYGLPLSKLNDILPGNDDHDNDNDDDDDNDNDDDDDDNNNRLLELDSKAKQ